MLWDDNLRCGGDVFVRLSMRNGAVVVYGGVFVREDSRVAVISMIIDDEQSVSMINTLLHDCREYIIGRMGIPYREKGLNIINVVLDAPMDVVSTLSGRLGRLNGVTSKAVYAKQAAELQHKEKGQQT